MPRSSTERWLRTLALLVLVLLPGTALGQQMRASAPARLVDVIDVNERDDQIDLTMIFNCAMRYVTSLPAGEGPEVHIQLVPLGDCGVNPLAQVPPENPPISGGGDILAAARMESLSFGHITLTLTFRKSERFVLAQGSDLRGLRVRLAHPERGRSKVIVSGAAEVETVSHYAVNLDSRPKPFTPADVQLAHQRLHAPAFVSEARIDGETWYRLRVGPIERRAEAERLLNLALAEYPRAWVAIGDDAVTSDLNAATVEVALPPVEPIGIDPLLPQGALKSMLADARTAVAARDFTTAIALLTKLQRQPEFPERAPAQELLGLARERAGQFAQAKAEYQEYLRRYPDREAADRVAFRLRILRAAEARARGGVAADPLARGWQLSGGAAQMGRYDGTRLSNGAPPPNTGVTAPPAPTNENALFTDVDLFARRRGDTHDWVARLSAGYDKVFGASATTGAATRVSLASVEMLDRPHGLLTRLGRQAQNQDGILGTFDGLFMAWQFKPAWAVNVAAGYPVQLLSVATRTAQRFETLALAYTPPGRHWDGSVFVAQQVFDGLRDRQAVGADARYLAATASVVALVDYDLFHRSLNTASLLATWQLPDRWSLSFDAERRDSPVLTTGNALIGQPYTSLSAMEQLYTEAQIHQLARDRTPVTSNYSVTASRPLGQRFQVSAIVAATSTGATVASGGVEAQPASGTLLSYQAQLYGSDLWRNGDFNTLAVTVGNTEIGRIDSLSATSRFPIGGAWRLGPRFTMNRLDVSTDGSRETTYIPSVLIDYQRNNKLFQFEAGGQLGSREAFLQLPTGAFVQTQNTTRYYLSVSYRISFQP